MKYYIVFALLLLLGAEVSAQNPYADGTVIPAGTSINSRWSVAAGTAVSTAGNFTSAADGTVSGAFTVNGNYTHSGWTRDRFLAGSVVEVFGDFYAHQELRVVDGATLIVHGDFYNYGGGSTRLAGNIVIAGDAFMSNTTVRGTGNVVIGGDLTMSGGSSSSGDIYLLDPNASSNVPGWMGVTTGDETDFINDEAGNTVLNDAVVDAGLVSSVDAPSGFTFDNLAGTSADLSWLLNADGNNVVIALYSSDTNAKPTDGVAYNVGQTLSDNAKIIYVGSGGATNYTHSGFTEGTSNYVRIWSVNGANEYSKAVKLIVKTLSSNVIFYEDFESGNANGWTLGRDGSSGNEWIIGSAEAYNGSASAFISNDGGSSSGYNSSRRTTIYLQNDVTIPSSYKSAELSFYWKGIGEDGYDGGSLRENRSTQLIDDASLNDQATWIEENIDITSYIGTRFDMDFMWYNDWNAGQNPGFSIDEVRIIGSEVARPRSLTGNVVSTGQVDLSWQKSIDDDNVIIAYSPFGSIGRPESGQSYTVGDFLTGGGQVLYVGAATGYSHSGTFSGQLSYTIWSVKGGTYSSGRNLKVTIPVALPYSEDFEGDVTDWNFNSGYDNAWVRGKATAYEGSQAAYISNDLGVTAGYDPVLSADTYLELEVDLRNYETADLTFRWRGNGNYNDFGSVYVDNDQLNGPGDTNNRRYYDRSSWQSETISLDAYTDAIHTIRFRWDNNSSGSAENPGFCIDNVEINGTIADPNNFMASNPDDLFNDLTWEKNAYDDDVLVAWSADGVFGVPETGVVYNAGDVLSGGGTILYLGDLLSFQHQPLNYGTTFYYKAWSERNGIYSTGIEKNATTPPKVSVLVEDWEDGSYTEWNTSNSSGTNSWLVGGSSTAAGGTKSAYIRESGSTAAGYNNRNTSEAWLEVDVNLVDLKQGTLSFDWKCDGELLGSTVYDYGEVYINVGGGDQIISADQEFYNSNTWQNKSIDLSAYIGNNATLKFRWVNDGSEGGPLGFCIDNIEVGGIYDPTSIVDNGQRLNTSIESIRNTEADALNVFSFDLTDKSSKYNDITRVQQLVISKGPSNTILDWSAALKGAILMGPDLPLAGIAGTVSSASITFTGSDIILLENEDVAETYTLKVWLNEDLNGAGIEDGQEFDFLIAGSDIVTGAGDDFIGIRTSSSGSIAIDVTTTQIAIHQQPSAYATFGQALSRQPVFYATDNNGNIDKSYNSTLNLSNSEGIAMAPNTMSFASGIASLSNLTFTGTGSSTLTVTAVSGSLTSAITEEIKIDSYWIPAHSNNNAYIHKVVINTIDNTSGKDANVYASYLDQQTSLTIGATYDVTVVVNNNSTAARYAFVWIDWDGNGDFESDERLDVDNTSSSGLVILNGSIAVPTGGDAVTGATRMRVQFIRNSNPQSSSTDNGESEDYTVILTSEGWRGQNNIWNVSQNWTSGSVPDINTDVYIPEHPVFGDIYPVIAADADMKDLEVAANAQLTIKTGTAVTISGDVTNYGTVLIENTNDQPASVITNGNVNGDMTIKWTYDNLRWWFIGHGISNPVMSSYQDIRLAQANNYVMYDYNGGSSYYKVSDNVATYDLPGQDELKGYLFKVKNTDAVVVHKGSVNNDATYTTPLKTDWQIIANPYPSYYQLPSDPAGTGDFGNTAGTVYVTVSTRNSDKTFETFNTNSGLSSPETFTGILAPSQAFYIKTDAGKAGADITMSASNRVQDAGKTSLKSSGSKIKDVLRIKLSNKGGGTDEAVLALMENGDFGYSRMDSEQRFNTNSLSYVYSVIDDNRAIINVLPTILDNYTQPLGIQAKEGQHSLYISGISNLSVDYELILEDKLTGTFMTMHNKQSVYEFTSEAGTFDDRFVLHFKPGIPDTPTDIEDVKSDSAVAVYVEGGSLLNITCQWQVKEKEVAVYSLSGELLGNYAFNGESFSENLELKTGIYIIELSGGNHTYRTKVFIK